jgi:hypothetical protein
MHLRANDYFDRRRTEHSVLAHVPPFACKERPARSRKCREIRQVAQVTNFPRSPPATESLAHQIENDLLQFRATGDYHRSAAFGPRASASQFAASAEGSIPPFTKPK